MSNTWTPLIKKQPHAQAKNKYLEAILITEENAKQVAKETDAFTVLDNGTLLTGFMSFQRVPLWMVALNPKNSTRKKYLFESTRTFDKYFELDPLTN